MNSWRRLFLISQIVLINLVGLTQAQPDMLGHFCNYISNSIYQANLNNLLSSLSANTDKYGFHSTSFGENPDTAHAIVLCRGDADLDTCRSCINNATRKLTQLCPKAKEGIGWYDYCMLRYSNVSMEGIMATDPRIFVWDDENVTSVALFLQAVAPLLGDLRGKAASGGPLRKYASGSTLGPDSVFIYALVQCTPDITEGNCSDCLQGAIDNLHLCCSGPKGGRVIRPSCHFRFESTGPFFREIPPEAPPPPALPIPPVSPGNRTNKSRTVIIIGVPILSTLLLLVLAFVLYQLRKKHAVKKRFGSNVKYDLGWMRFVTKLFKLSRQRGVHHTGEEETLSQSVESLKFDFSTLKAATNDFSNDNMLGHGGFGSVYKGKLLNGQEIAVKRLADCSEQGEVQFKNEILLLANLQHKNLVRLLGFCLEGEERLLIYEFLPNTSLDRFIFDPIKRLLLDWEVRYKIIVGTAHGLLYLHQDSQLTIIHHDLKAGNVLLDGEKNPKIADFGMARLFRVDQSRGSTKKIAGTLGYMPPEYAKFGKFSVKTDVFSFGVLILEIVSGKKNSGFRGPEDAEHLISYAWGKWRQGKASRLIDPTLRGGSKSEKTRCIHIGLLCVQENVAKRPTMDLVVLMLSSFSMSLQSPTKPAFLMDRSSSEPNTVLRGQYPTRVTSSDPSPKHSVNLSVNEASITDLYPR